MQKGVTGGITGNMEGIAIKNCVNKSNLKGEQEYWYCLGGIARRVKCGANR